MTDAEDASDRIPEADGLAVGFLVREDRVEVLPRIPNAAPEHGWSWIHLDRTDALRARTLASMALDPLVAEEIEEQLLVRHSRPHARILGRGLLLVGRGLPDHDDAAHDDTVSMRAWLEPRRLVTVSRAPIRAVRRLAEEIAGGDVPTDPPDALLRIIDGMTHRMADAVEDLGDRLDELNRDVIDESVVIETSQLVPLRIRAIVLHRYLLPLRTALHDLSECRLEWISADDRAEARAIRERLTRVIEELDSLHSRSVVARDEIVSRQNERLNRRLYGLTVLTAIFLPLAFFTGALGMNLAGIPFADRPWAFAGAVVASFGLVLLELGLLRRVGWL